MCTDDPNRSSPNPTCKVAQARLRKVHCALAQTETARRVAASTNVGTKRKTKRGFKIADAELTAAASKANTQLARFKEALEATPTRVELQDLRPDATVLDEKRNLVTHAIRMSTYNTESSLVRMLAPHFPIDKGRALLREALNSPGDL